MSNVIPFPQKAKGEVMITYPGMVFFVGHSILHGDSQECRDKSKRWFLRAFREAKSNSKVNLDRLFDLFFDGDDLGQAELKSLIEEFTKALPADQFLACGDCVAVPYSSGGAS